MWCRVGILVLFTVVVSGTPANRMSDHEARAIQKLFEKGNYFEGDMLFPDGVNVRNGITYLPWRWTNNTVYYEISDIYTTAQQNIIIGGLNEIEGATCIKFVPRTNQANYIHIKQEKSGCSAYVGMIGGGQRVNLEIPGCVYHQVVVHEVLHALGFHHQQSATNRDDYVEIQWENIEEDKQYNYDKYGAETITDFGIRYDYESIMHYSDTAFSMNGEKTIITKDPAYQNVIGKGLHLSAGDIAKINAMYNC